MAPPNIPAEESYPAQQLETSARSSAGVNTIVADGSFLVRTAYNQISEDDLWFLHGRYYDLVSFMDKHPGGPTMLRWAKGRDATELFESYHVFTDKHRKMMAKYEVKKPDVATTWITYFDWNKKDIYNEIIEGVKDDFKKNGITDWKCSTSRYFFIAFLGCVFAATFIPWSQGYWWAAFAFPITNWIFGIQAYHCASHSAMSNRPWVNQMWTYLFFYFSSPTTWGHQHVVGHHAHTNIANKDPDMMHGVPYFRTCSSMKYRPIYKHQHKYVLFFWSFVLIFMSAYLDYKTFIRKSYYGVVPLMHHTMRERKLHFFGRVIANLLVFIPPFIFLPFFKAFAFYLIFMSVFSMCFMMSTQVNHLTEEALEEDRRSTDWAVQQIITSHDFGHDSWWWTIFTGGLNFQIEHHLFPGVNAGYLPRIAPIVKAVCKKHNIPYNYSPTFTEALRKYMSNMIRLSVPQKGEIIREEKSKSD